MRWNSVMFWVCFVMVILNAVLLYKTLTTPILAHMTTQHILTLVVCSFGAYFAYLNDRK